MESGVQPGIDLNELDDKIKIKSAVQEGRILEAISLVNDLHPELLDNDRYLFFRLQQQHLIELIRENKDSEAIKFAQTHLAERAEECPDVLNELERTLCLLVHNNGDKSPFDDLLHDSQRRKVASELNSAILESESRDCSPHLANVLKLLLWSQDELDMRKVRYPKMTDLVSGAIEDSR